MAHLTTNKKDNLYYQIIDGQADKPYLVFLHEGLGCTAMWHGFPQMLCQKSGCPGLIYDRLGYGQSSPCNRNRTIHYLHDSALNELPELVERLIPAHPYILIGHSDGGSISLLHGAERPPMLRGIITEAAHIFIAGKTLAGIREAQAAWACGKLKGLSKYHGQSTESVFMAWSETWRADWFKSWNIEYLLPCIEVPLLVIQGQDDKYGEAAQAITIANHASGYSQLELIENCGHVPHLEDQESVLDLMADFIDNLEQKKA